VPSLVRAVVGSCCRRPPVTIIGSAGKKDVDVGFELVVMTHFKFGIESVSWIVLFRNYFRRLSGERSTGNFDALVGVTVGLVVLFEVALGLRDVKDFELTLPLSAVNDGPRWWCSVAVVPSRLAEGRRMGGGWPAGPSQPSGGEGGTGCPFSRSGPRTEDGWVLCSLGGLLWPPGPD
jgi:hypothetical protein